MHLQHVIYITIVLAEIAMIRATRHVEQQDQYFSQDAYGQYSYGYSAPHSTKREVRTVDGVTRGSYSYLEPTGKWQTVQYVADANGFRLVGTNVPPNDLIAPEPVTETYEVAAARAHHLAAHEQLKLRTSSLLNSSQQPENSFSTYLNGKASLLPYPVQDTAEVVDAKLKFFARYEEERQRHQLIREQRAAVVSHQTPFVLETTPTKNLEYK